MFLSCARRVRVPPAMAIPLPATLAWRRIFRLAQSRATAPSGRGTGLPISVQSFGSFSATLEGASPARSGVARTTSPYERLRPPALTLPRCRSPRLPSSSMHGMSMRPRPPTAETGSRSCSSVQTRRRRASWRPNGLTTWETSSSPSPARTSTWSPPDYPRLNLRRTAAMARPRSCSRSRTSPARPGGIPNSPVAQRRTVRSATFRSRASSVFQRSPYRAWPAAARRAGVT